MSIDIRSDDQRAYVQIQPSLPPSHGALTLAVQLHAHGFSGRYGNVGVFVVELHRFTLALEQLERQRTGAATLHSISPDAFVLTVTMADRAGHIRVTGSLRRYKRVVDDFTALAVSVAFELDPSTLPAVVEQFQQLLHGC